MADSQSPQPETSAQGVDEATQQLVEITAERDSMIHLLKTVASEVNDFLSKQCPEANSTQNAAGQNTSSEAEKLRQAQRQIDELSRRIIALEGIQRSSALELQREREIRLKAEKILANAERVQAETAAHMDATKATIRKEVEAIAHQREVEMKRTHKEVQEQLMYLQDTHRRTLAELERAIANRK